MAGSTVWRRVAWLIAAVGVLAVGTADSAWGQSWYGDFDGGAAYLKLPASHYFANFTTAPETRTSDLKINDGQGFGFVFEGRLGRILARPLLNADSSRVEFQGFFQQQWDRDARSFLDGGAGAFGWATLNGMDAQLTGDGLTLDTTVNASNSFYGGDLLLRQDRDRGPNRMCTLYGGGSLLRLDQITDLTGTRGGVSVELREQLNTTYVGVKLGASEWRRLDPVWTLKLDANIGLYGACTQYGVTSTLLNDGAFVTTAAATASRLVYAPQVGIDLTRQLNDRWFLSFYTTLTYVSYAPSMRYGTFGAPAPGLGVPRIDNGDLLSNWIGVRFVFIQ